MKKKRFTFTLILVAVLAVLSFTLIACGEQAKEEYSVTVLAPDETPLSGITVTWVSAQNAKSSADTDESGKATVSLPLGTYSIELSGYQEGLVYTAVSVTGQMRKLTLTLSVQQVEYTATVTDKDGSPASGVTVTWSSGTTAVGTATTDASGKATRTLDYGDYTVTVSNLPDGNIPEGSLAATGKSPDVSFNLIGGVTANYSVTLKSEGGLLFKNTPMNVYSGEDLISTGETDELGVFSFTIAEGEYKVAPDPKYIPQGYTYDYATLSETSRSATLVAYSAVIPIQGTLVNTRYVMGSIIHDYSFTTPYEVDGEKVTYTISDILKEKDAVIINNWGTNCTWCLEEMPAMNAAYEKYKDSIELLAVSNYQGGDSDSVIVDFHDANGFSFPMMRDGNGFATKFGLTGWPATIVIDRYGAVARIEAGAILDSEVWERMILKYIGEDYVQTFTPGTSESDSINNEVAKPDITVPNGHYENIAATINNTEHFPQGASVTYAGETVNEYAWPFILKTDEDVSPTEAVLCASNTDRANSMAILYITVNVEPGKVFTFDYWAQTQTSDILSFVWDGKIIKQISGNVSGNGVGWQTCYLYSEITGGDHSLALAYIKDNSGNVGKDNVFIKNVRFTEIADIEGSSDMLRAAAYGVPEEDATRFPHYADVAIEDDGYYHVNLSTLKYSQYAGNDPKPMLFVNLMNVTNWSNDVSIQDLIYATNNSGEYVYDCNFTIDGVKKDYRDDFIGYLRSASVSYVDDCVPVDKELHDLLVAFMARVSGSHSHKDEWLEACYFYSHYGEGNPIGNPILGVTKKTAIPLDGEGLYTADVTRPMNPVPTNIYTFTPETSGLYKIESLIPDKDALQYSAIIWLYDENTTAERPLAQSDERFNRDGTNEQNFVMYFYMEANHKYYLEMAFNMNELGTFDFTIENAGDEVKEIVACSAGTFTADLDEEGNLVGNYYLAGAVEYAKDDDGYFHVVNEDGSLGSFIYLDVKYPTSVTTRSLTQLLDENLKVPFTNDYCDYTTFNFRYMIAYINYYDSESGEYVYSDYVKDFDLEVAFRDEVTYKDYTDIMRGYIAKAETEPGFEGLVKVDGELADILNLFIETRINSLQDGILEAALENEWLRFCWYEKTYSAPAENSNA